MLPTNEIVCRDKPNVSNNIIGMLVMYYDAVNKKDSKKQYRNYRQGVINNQKIYKNVSKVVAVIKNSYCRTIIIYYICLYF